MPTDLLILTAGYGEGHNAAARGLLSAARQLGVSAGIADPYTSLGAAYDRSRRDYLSLINRAPKVWAAMFGAIDRWPIVEFILPALRPVKLELARLLEEMQPRVVVSVYPVYPFLIRQLYPTRRPFEFHTVITDSITINRVWHQAPSDSYIVPNAASGAVLRQQGIRPGLIRELGFPVNPRFAADRPARPSPDDGPRVLFMINAGRDTAPDVVSCLLTIPRIHLSITVGRDEDLRRRIEEAAAGRPIEIHGWINHMPELLMTHHILIGKAGGAAVQETIAAQTPMLITQVVPGQEEGNARLLFDHHCGALCPTPLSLAQRVEKLFANNAREWREWERNIQLLSRPSAALRIVEALTSQD